MAPSLYFQSSRSLRQIQWFLYSHCCIAVFHVTIYRWIRRFTPFFKAVSNPLLQTANLQSNEWHADETFMKIRGVTHYLWILLDSEKRVVIAFYLSALRDSSAPLQLFQEAHCLTDAQPAAIITDGLWAYAMPIKMAYPHTEHHADTSFAELRNHPLLEAFHKAFKG